MERNKGNTFDDRLRNKILFVVCFLLGNYPKETIQHTEHGESLKSRRFYL